MITIAGFAIFISICIALYNYIKSARSGEIAEGNVWNSRSPEWQIPNPAPLHNYHHPFHVVGEPYDYGLQDAPYVDMNPAQAAAE